MKAMIWKEWRENAVWTLTALLFFSIATQYFASQALHQYSWSTHDNPLGNSTAVTVFMAPLFALILGVLQIAPELRRDQWAFLLHRPVSRSIIFAGKAVAGLAMYFAAALTPLLILTWWASLPGSVPVPFDWRLLLGPFCDIIGGAAFYFVGVLCSIRQARWYGSRFLSFPVAVLGLAYSNTVPEFWQALVIVLFTVGLLAVAAWGSFLTTGTYERQPRIAKVALGVSTYFGIVTVVGTVSMFVLALAYQGRASVNRTMLGMSYNAPMPASFRTEYAITTRGQIARLNFNANDKAFSGTDLQGRPVQPTNHHEIHSLERYSLHSHQPDRSRYNFRSVDRYYQSLLISSLSDEQKPLFYWSAAQRRVLLYNRKGNRIVGSVGPNGYVSGGETLAEPFREDLLFALADPFTENSSLSRLYNPSVRFLQFKHSLYLLQDKSPTLTQIYSTARPDGIQGVAVIPSYAGTSKYLVAVLAEDRINFLTSDGKFLFGRMLWPQVAKDYNISVLATGQLPRIFIWYDPRYSKGPAAVKTPYIKEFSTDGQTVAKTLLPPLVTEPSEPRLFAWQPYWHQVAVPVTEVPAVVMAAGLGFMHFGAQGMGQQERTENLRMMQTFFIGSVLMSLVCILVAKKICQRASLSDRATRLWMWVTLPLGLSALLLLLALHAWPARVTCPKCGQLRSVENDLCEHCFAPFALPEYDDATIFEDQLADYDVERLLERV